MVEEKPKRPLFWFDLNRILNLSTHFLVTKIFRLSRVASRLCGTNMNSTATHQHSTHTHTHRSLASCWCASASCSSCMPYLCLWCRPATLPTATSTRVTARSGTYRNAFCTLLAPPLWIRFTIISRGYSR